MPLIGRRRPLLRAAMVGGAGYVAGKKMSQSREREASQDQQISELQQGPQQAAPAPAAAPVTSEADRVEALTKLKDLRDSDVLTQEQFEAERQKLLQGL